MDTPSRCPYCQTTLPAEAMQGVCPRCLGSMIPGLPSEGGEKWDIAEQPGDRIGPYKLLEQIGEGGCGVVYLAEQEQPIRRRVALKVIKAGMDTKRVIARFEAERQALALMDHPNIAKVLEAGTTGSGRPYFVMELVQGSPITAYCDQRQLPCNERLELFIQVCHAIQHAHQKGIIHRDIKPSNILVAIHDGTPVPKVIDFGISKATEQPLTDKTLFTALERFIGTPAYMSPEQADMSDLDVDTRSDIYSLGVLLYELLTGRTPFDVQKLMEQGIDALRQAIREKEPIRPSTRLRQTQSAERGPGSPSCIPPCRSRIENDLDWIVMKCLEKDRARRYDTVNALAADLQRHLAHEPIQARPPSKFYRLQKSVRRNRLAFAAAGTTVLALLLGLLLAAWEAIRATRARDAAVVAQERANATAETLRLQVYAADMRAADIAVRQENLGQARQLLRTHIPKPGENDLRGVEWRYLWLKAQGDEAIIFTHEYPVISADVSPSGRLVGTVVEDEHRGRIWDSESRRVVQDFSLHEPRLYVRRMAFHSELPLIAVHYLDRLTVWNTSNWQPVMEEQPAVPGAEVWVALDLHGVEVCFSGDGQVLGRLHKDGFETWQVQGWKKTLNAGELPIKYEHWNRLLLSRDGSECFYSSRNGNNIRCWNLPTRSLRWELSAVDRPYSIEISPDGAWLAAGTIRGRVLVWSLPDRQLVADYPAHQANVYALAFSPDGKWMASVGADHDIRLWKSGTSTNVARLRGHFGVPWSLRFSADNRWLVSASIDNTARLWRLSRFLEQTNCFTVPQDHILDPDFGPGPSFRTYHTTERAFQTHSVADGRLLQSIPLSPASLLTNARVMTVRGSYGLVSGDNYGNLCFWDRATGQLVRSNNISPNPVKPALLSESQRFLCASEGFSNRVAVLIYDLTADRVLASLTNAGFFGGPAAAFSPNETLFAHGERGGTFSVWDLPSQRRVCQIKATRATIIALSFSPDGKLLAASDNENTVGLWVVADGRRLHPPLTGHLVGVFRLQFSEDSRTLFSYGTDRTFRMWHVATGREMVAPLPLSDHLRSPMIPNMTRDNSWLLETLDGDGLRWLRLPTLAEIDAAEGNQLNP